MFSLSPLAYTLLLTLTLTLTLTLISVSHCSVILSNSTTAYEILEDNGFPAGLLPTTVSSYDLADDGDFELYLEAACTVKIPNLYPIKYKATISGNIVTGKLSSLSGISVKVLLIWWSISSITVSGENLVFKVGPATASYAISNFDESPTCQSSYNNPFAQVS